MFNWYFGHYKIQSLRCDFTQMGKTVALEHSRPGFYPSDTQTQRLRSPLKMGILCHLVLPRVAG